MWTFGRATHRLVPITLLAAVALGWPGRLTAADLLSPGPGGLLPLHATRQRLTASFLYRFPEFVAWPEGEHAGPFVIGILGDDELANMLEQMVGRRTIEGRRVDVERLDAPVGIARCQIAFFGDTGASIRPDVLALAAESHVLTVSRRPAFALDGGVIALLPAGDDLRLEINLAAARYAGLRISSRLLKLAAIVGGPQP